MHLQFFIDAVLTSLRADVCVQPDIVDQLTVVACPTTAWACNSYTLGISMQSEVLFVFPSLHVAKLYTFAGCERMAGMLSNSRQPRYTGATHTTMDYTPTYICSYMQEMFVPQTQDSLKRNCANGASSALCKEAMIGPQNSPACSMTTCSILISSSAGI